MVCRGGGALWWLWQSRCWGIVTAVVVVVAAKWVARATAWQGGPCNCGVHGNMARTAMRARRGGECSSGVHGDAVRALMRARQGVQ